MDFQVLQFKPGVSRESTKYTNEGNWYESDKVRFRAGYPQKIGGWVNYAPGAMMGICRNMTEWVTLLQQYMLGLGTNLKYYVLYGNIYWDITPFEKVENMPINPFYTMFNSLKQAVSDTAVVLPVNNVAIANMTKVAPFVVKINDELIYVPVVDATANTLGTTTQPCHRGFNGTVGAPHSVGAAVSSSWVVVDSLDAPAAAGNYVQFAGATGFSNLPADLLNSNVRIESVVNQYYTVDFGVQSVAAAEGGGLAVTAGYEIPVGFAYPQQLYGWGAGPWGMGHGWGTPAPAKESLVDASVALWSADNFGQDLVMCRRGAGIYYWAVEGNFTPSGQVIGRAINIRDLPNADGFAPPKSTMVLITDERFIIALGCVDVVTNGVDGPLDPMFVAWCDQNNPPIWDPQVQNLAGSYRLTYGSGIVSAISTRQEILIWTDTALYSMRFTSSPFVYGFFPLNTNITIVSQNAAATANGITYWMGHEKFYVYNGTVNTLPCTLWQYIFDDINQSQWAQVYCSTNEEFNEVWWFYCSTNSEIIDRYVVYNHLENVWHYGTMSRTAWLDSHIKGSPIAAATIDPGNAVVLSRAARYTPSAVSPDLSGQIVPEGVPLQQLVQHEIGCDNGETNPPSPIHAFIGTGDFDLGTGGYRFASISRIIPDMDFIGSTNENPSVMMTLTAQNFPGVGINTDPYQVSVVPTLAKKQTAQVFDYTKQVWIRLRGRQISFRVESTDLGIQWQLGSPRAQIQADGRRG